MSDEMPRSDETTPARWSALDAAKVAQLDTKVSGLDGDVKQINVRLDGVYKKIDSVAGELGRVVGELSHEMRSGMDVLSDKMSDKSTPKFGVIFAGLTLMTTVLGLIGGIAFYPIKGGLDETKADIRRIEDQRYYETQRQLTDLISENRRLHDKEHSQ